MPFAPKFDNVSEGPPGLFAQSDVEIQAPTGIVVREYISPTTGKEKVIAAVNHSTPSRQNQACWGLRRCAT
jgi:hypothetical protein